MCDVPVVVDVVIDDDFVDIAVLTVIVVVVVVVYMIYIRSFCYR